MQNIRTVAPWLTMVLAMNVILDARSAETAEAGRSSIPAYVGTYTGPKSKGIYATRFDPTTGSLTPAVLAAETINPTFLAVHPNKRWLYAVNETDRFAGKRTGAVAAYAIEKATGKLTLLNQKESGGAGACHVSLDSSGKCVLVANYGSGSVAAYKVGADGSLSDATTVIQHTGSSINPQRQSGPHAHQILSDRNNRFALACDLGLDKVLVMEFKPKEALLLSHQTGINVQPGSGPRHLAFHPNGRSVFLLNEMSSTLTTMAYDPKTGRLQDRGTISTLPAGFSGNNSGAEIQAHPSGKYVYSSNRGDNSIAIFAVEPKTGALRYVGREPTHGQTPRHFVIDAAGKWLLAENQDSNNIVVFRIDPKTGLLTAAGQSLEVVAPVCLALLE